MVDEGEDSEVVGGEGRLLLSSSSCSGLTKVPSARSTTGNGSWEWTLSSLMLDSAALMARRDWRSLSPSSLLWERRKHA